MSGTSVEPPWWRDAVVYQVYVRSFADGNGDGIGDIPGIRSRLEYIHALGVDAIWVNPWYESPMKDGGYDVSNYRSIDPDFGTLDDARALIEEANEVGIRLLVDLVPNHTSSQHHWFIEALGSQPGSEARARYHFLEGRGLDGSQPPNNWRSIFGGPAWTRVPDGQWYLHLFAPSQPDLNWDNLDVRAEFLEIIRFWLDFGADGFRVDVANALIKDPTYPDLAMDPVTDQPVPPTRPGAHPFLDRDELQEIVEEWRSLLREYPGAVMVAEAAGIHDWHRLAHYLQPDFYQQAFNFPFLQARWIPDEVEFQINQAIEATRKIDTVATWVLSNHDLVRHTTRYGLPDDVVASEWLLDGDRSLLDEEKGLRRARAAIVMLLGLPGSIYLYQGEELGLPEVYDLPLDVLQDPTWEGTHHRVKGRDGCRVPIPWTVAGESFGFGADGAWLPQPEDWGEMSVEAEEAREDSTLHLYRKAIGIRGDRLRFDDEFSWLKLGSDVLAYRRECGLVCVVNFGHDPVELPEGDVLVASGPLADGLLPMDTSAWVQESDS